MDALIELVRHRHGFSHRVRSAAAAGTEDVMALRFLGAPALLARGREAEAVLDDARLVRPLARGDLLAGLLSAGPARVPQRVPPCEAQQQLRGVVADRRRVAELVRLARDRWNASIDRWQWEGRGNVYATAVDACGLAALQWAGAQVDDATGAELVRRYAAALDGPGLRGERERRWVHGWFAQQVLLTRAGGDVRAGSPLALAAGALAGSGDALAAEHAATLLGELVGPRSTRPGSRRWPRSRSPGGTSCGTSCGPRRPRAVPRSGRRPRSWPCRRSGSRARSSRSGASAAT